MSTHAGLQGVAPVAPVDMESVVKLVDAMKQHGLDVEFAAEYTTLLQQLSRVPPSELTRLVQCGIGGTSSTGLTRSQSRCLRAQLAAWRQLSRGVAPHASTLQHALLPALRGTPEGASRNHASPLPMQGQLGLLSHVAHPADASSHAAASAGGVGGAVGAPTATSVHAHTGAQRAHAHAIGPKPELPTAMAAGLTRGKQALLDREYRVRHCLQSRMQQLRGLHVSALSPVQRIKAIKEYKALQLLSIQKKLRLQMLRSVSAFHTLHSAAEWQAFKREEVNLVPTVNPELERAKQRKATAEWGQFLRDMAQHTEALRFHHAMIRDRHVIARRGLAKAHRQSMSKAKKEDEKREAARVAALKANDYEGYLKMLQETKNSRLTQLIDQTEQYLSHMTSLLALEKSKAVAKDRRVSVAEVADEAVAAATAAAAAATAAGGDAEAAAESPSQDHDSDGTNGAAKPDDKVAAVDRGEEMYFRLAHSKTEKVEKQPSILVGGTLKHYQLVGLQWLVSLYNNNLNGILADEMGLGKTVQTIALITYLIEAKSNLGPFLVVVPNSTIPNWRNEFNKWAPSVKVVTYLGTPRVRAALCRQYIATQSFNVLLTTYEFVIRDKAKVGKPRWNYIIVDEGHRMKNKQSRLSQTLSRYYSRHRLILTGTPLQNNLPELWALLNFLLPNIFGSVTAFDDWFNKPFESVGERVDMTEEESLLVIRRLHQVLRPFLLRRLKSDVESELPDKIEKVIRVPMSAWQAHMYARLMNEGLIARDSSQGRSGGMRSLNNHLMQLRKMCNHPYLFLDEWDADQDLIRVSGKLDLLDRILPKLKASGHRVLIFNQMTRMMDILAEFLDYRQYRFLRLDGSTSSEDRDRYLTDFNAPNSPYFVFILSTKAGGVGLNLQTADTVILFDSDWNPQMDLQAQDRVHRIGQTKEVLVIRLITHQSVEERILQRAMHKLDMESKVIGAGMFDRSSKAEDRRRMLMDLLQRADDANGEGDADTGGEGEASGVTAELLASTDAVPSEKQVDSMIARSEAEFDLFRSMEKQRGNEAPRLMQPHELPEWLTVVAKPRREERAEDLGKGKRQRSRVNYAEQLTEMEWAEAIERGEHPEDAAERLREARANRSRRSKRTRVVDAKDDSDEDDDSDGNEDESFESTSEERAHDDYSDEEEDDDDEDEEEEEDDDDDDDYGDTRTRRSSLRRASNGKAFVIKLKRT